MRKLASIQEIVNLSPIEGADRIEQAQVLGWSMVVKKGEFRPGDLCVFFEIDSVLPDDKEWAAFLSHKNYCVKTAKFKGALAQGLALPLSILPQECEIEIDKDVTEILNVTKRDPQIKIRDVRIIAGSFPARVPKTDEIRLQSIPRILQEIVGVPLVATIKMDGMSGTYYKEYGEFFVCSRNFSLKEADNFHWRMANKYDIKNILPDGIAIQGEVCGPGIQQNRMKLQETDLFIFNVLDVKNNQYFAYEEMLNWCKERKLKVAPEAFKLVPSIENVDDWLNLSEGCYPGTDAPREGIVVRPLKEQHSPYLKGRLSFKVISNAYLLKHKE